MARAGAVYMDELSDAKRAAHSPFLSSPSVFFEYLFHSIKLNLQRLFPEGAHNMGVCGSSLTPEQKAQAAMNKEIEKQQRGNANQEDQKIKLLLLGA